MVHLSRRRGPASNGRWQRGADAARGLLVFPILVFLFAAAHADVLRLKEGGSVEGTAQGCDGDKVAFALAAGGTASYPLARIDRLVLSETPAQAALLGGGPGTAPDRRDFWTARLPFLRVPGSDAGAAGLALAAALLGSETAEGAAEAGKIAAQVAGDDWDAARRERARALGAVVLLAQGKPAEAAQAAALLASNAADPAARADARFVLARDASDRLGRFVAAHPRWSEAPGLAARRDALLSEALDAYLASPVLLPADRFRAARGLWEAASLAASAGRTAEAAGWLDDLASAFPDPLYLPRARELRQRLAPASS